MAKKIEVGTRVRFRTLSGDLVHGVVIGRGDANDGTGRHEYYIRVNGDVYSRPRAEIKVIGA